jgi:hypothetical protein
MSSYYTEMLDFKVRQLRILGRSDREIARYADELKEQPEVGIINATRIFPYVAAHRIATTFLERIALYESDPAELPLGSKPERYINMFYKQCENEVIARSKTPRDVSLGEQLMYEAMREQYSEELVYLSARINVIERESK